jgi:hypothetical protein
MSEFMRLSFLFKPNGGSTGQLQSMQHLGSSCVFVFIVYMLFLSFLLTCLLPWRGKEKMGPQEKTIILSGMRYVKEEWQEFQSGLQLDCCLKKGKPRNENDGANVLVIVTCSSGDNFEVKREMREYQGETSGSGSFLQLSPVPMCPFCLFQVWGGEKPPHPHVFQIPPSATNLPVPSSHMAQSYRGSS